MASRKDSKGRVLKEGESQRKDGMYMYRYREINGERTYVYAKDLKKLRMKEDAIRKYLDEAIANNGNERTVITQLKISIKHKSYRQSSLNTANRFIAMITQFDFANIPLSKVNQSLCKEFIKGFNAKYSQQTTMRALSYLKAAFHEAVGDGLLRKNPLDFRYLSMLTQNINPPREGLTEEEFDSLIAYMESINHWLIPHTIFLRETGLRIGEFLGLSLDDINFTEHTIHIQRQLQTRRDGTFFISPPKTESSNAVIPLTNVAENALVKLIELHPDTIDFDGAAHLFVLGCKNSCLIRVSSMDTYYRRLNEKYNKAHPEHPIKITPHILRHSTPAHYFKQGMQVPFVQKIMRHSESATTMKIYTHLNESDIAGEMKKNGMR